MKLFRSTLAVALLLAFETLQISAQNPLEGRQDLSAGSDQPAQRNGRGAMSGMIGGVAGRGAMGTVTEIAPDHFIVKTGFGELYTVHYSVNTRIMKAPPRPAPPSSANDQQDRGPYLGLPISIKASEIRVGDTIGASGEVNSAAKSVGAIAIMLIDPETARRMRQMQANYGKTWLMGRVTSVKEKQVTIEGGPDNAGHTFFADENTTFRKRHAPITLADIQTGDVVRVEGQIKNNVFVATSVYVMGPRSDRSDH